MDLNFSIRENMAPGRTLTEKFDALAEMGFAGIEITASSKRECAEEIGKASKRTGIVPNVLSSPELAILDANPDRRAAAIASIKEVLTICGELGGVGIVFPPLIDTKMRNGDRIPDLSPLVTTEQLEKDLLTAILKEEIAPHAEKCGSSLIVEPLNRYEQWWPCTIQHGVDICEAVGSPGITTMADLFHMNIEDADLGDAIRTGGKHIANVHLADSNRILPGYGHTDFVPALRALEDIGYDKYCGFECRIPQGKDPRDELTKSMAYLTDL